MRVLQIDAENFSWKYATLLQAIAQQIGIWSTGGIYGHAVALGHWLSYGESWHLPVRKHGGGKNAADALLCKDAWEFYHQGARTFVIASSDGDYAQLVANLKSLECQVFRPKCSCGER